MKLRPRAEVFIFKRNRILCATRSYVAFPGGGIDDNESAVHAAQRECFEEAGRKLSNCTVAHPPTLQRWSAEYKAKRASWKGEYEGGLTYWMTGSSSDNPVPPGYRHPDYEPMEWKTVKEVLTALKKELGGDWNDDVAVRIKVLETHLGMQQRHKEAEEEPLRTIFLDTKSPFPALNIR